MNMAFKKLPYLINIVLFAGMLFVHLSYSQRSSNYRYGNHHNDPEVLGKCGYAESELHSSLLAKRKGSFQSLIDTSSGFGYGYDSLELDLSLWEKSPHVTVSSLGKSVQQREIYLLTITQNAEIQKSKNVITIHNRTHPLEVQSWWVQKEMITFLLSDALDAAAMRHQNIYYMIPMINPDGVMLMEDCEAGFGRCNALGVDLEREWATTTPQVEVQHLKDFYLSLMESENPIRIALNMHSAFGCLRYFWYHLATGTSQAYALKQQTFIEQVVIHSQGEISPWSTKTSWSTAPDYFPESWFWFNYQEKVLALTYEDVKDCPYKESQWQIPAMALLKGMQDYLGENTMIIQNHKKPAKTTTITIQQGTLLFGNVNLQGRWKNAFP